MHKGSLGVFARDSRHVSLLRLCLFVARLSGGLGVGRGGGGVVVAAAVSIVQRFYLQMFSVTRLRRNISRF